MLIPLLQLVACRCEYSPELKLDWRCWDGEPSESFKVFQDMVRSMHIKCHAGGELVGEVMRSMVSQLTVPV